MKKDLIPIAALQEKAAALTPVQKLLVLVGTFIVLGAGFYFLILMSQLDTVKSLTGKIADQEKKLVTLKQAVKQVAAIEKELVQSEEELRVMRSKLPHQKEIPDLLNRVSLLGAEVGLENILFQPQAEQVKEFYATIPIRLDLVGDFNQLLIYLDNISKLNRILKVESLTMMRQKESSRLQVNCTMVTYRFLDKPVEQKPGKTPAKDAKKTTTKKK